MDALALKTRFFSLALSLIFVFLLSNPSEVFSNEIAPGETGEVTITKYGISATVSGVSVGAAIGDNAKYIASNTTGTWSQSGSTLTIKFNVTLTNDAPVGESISLYFMVLIMTSGSISNLPDNVTIDVTEPEGIRASFTASPTEGVAPLSVNFTDNSTGGASTWNWLFGDGGTSTSQHPVHTYDSPGNYTVTLHVTGTLGYDQHTEEDYISVLPVIADFSASPTKGLVPLTVEFTDESMGEVNSWLWDFGDGNTSTDQHPVHTYNSSGDFSVSLSVTSSEGEDAMVKNNFIEVAAILADFSASQTGGINPLTVHFSDESLGTVSQWIWDFGDGVTSDEQNPVHIYDSTGTFTVTLTAKEADGESDIEEKDDYINSAPLFGDKLLITDLANSAQSVFASDLDGDGDNEVLLASQFGDKIAWHENQGDGTFGEQQMVAHPATDPKAVFAADLDGDGDHDILSASVDGWSNMIVWYENLDNGLFGERHIVTLEGRGVSAVYASDLDNDGDMDVISAHYNYGVIAWCENLGEGVFGPRQVITDKAKGANSVHSDDLDGDGDMDVLSAENVKGFTDNVSWYENQGNGSFGDRIVITADYTYEVTSVFTADLDGDGDPDVLATSQADNEVGWYENLGGGAFGVQNLLNTNAAGAKDVFAIDLDGDGDVDVVSVSADDNKIAWYENIENDSIGSEQIVSTEVDSPRSVFAADLDGDSDNDIISASRFDDKIAWYENLGDGSFGPQKIITTEADGAIDVFVKDFDNDGDQDVLSASATDQKVAWYENLGNGLFGSPNNLTPTTNGAYDVTTTDMNGDGWQDIVAASAYDDKVSWFKNQGDGSFGMEHVITTEADIVGSVCVADLDGDQDPDILSTSPIDNEIAWYANMENDSFGIKQVITLEAMGARSVFAADLDGDGDIDVLSASDDDDKIAWYENLENDTFGIQQVITIEANAAHSVYAADLDNDGDQDVMSASRDDDKIAWYENLGNGSFDIQKIISDGARSAREVYAADLNGDGYLDVMSASYNDDKIAWYENTGSGGFYREQIVSTNVDGASSVFSSDLDGDGDPDLLAASSIDDEIVWFENKLALKASFEADKTEGKAPLDVGFYLIHNGYPKSWHWDFGDGNTSNEQNPGYMYTSPGTYSVTLIVADSSRADTVIKADYISVLEPVSVPEVNESNITKDGLKIFPNPASSSLTVEYIMEESDVMELVIFNFLGQMVKRTQMGYQSPGVNDFNMDISELSEGVYFISVISESFKSSQKLIISR